MGYIRWKVGLDQRHRLSPGQYFIIPAGVKHTYGAEDEDPWSIYWLHFSGETASRYTEGSVIPRQLPTGKSIVDWKQLFEEILHTFEEGYSSDKLRFMSTVLTHLLGLLMFSPTEVRYVKSGSLEQMSIDKCRDYVKSQLDRKIVLSDIVTASGYSTTHCVNLFRKIIGITPMAYVLQLKIEEACRLLELTNLKVNQICERVGIYDPYYFSRAFKKITGGSPSSYRARILHTSTLS